MRVWSPFAVNNSEKSKLHELKLGLFVFMMCLLFNQSGIYLQFRLVNVSVSNFPEHFSPDFSISLKKKKSQTFLLRHHHSDLKNKRWNICDFIL